MESGLIVLWSGAIADIPTGFVLCDGSNNTPDLRNKFVVGAGNSYAIDDTGGNPLHTHTFTEDGHAHTNEIAPPSDHRGDAADSRMTLATDTGTTDQAGPISAYYALAFIMRK